MTPRPVTNIGASVRQRLLNLARERGEPFDQVLQYFAIERFLARLATTPWADVLVVKGATLLRFWNAPLGRPTRDIDFHTRLVDGASVARVAVAEVVALEQDDGLVFDGEIASEPIVVDGRYPGVRLAVKGSLAGARFKLQVDVGVGAEVVPEPAGSTTPFSSTWTSRGSSPTRPRRRSPRSSKPWCRWARLRRSVVAGWAVGNRRSTRGYIIRLFVDSRFCMSTRSLYPIHRILTQ